MALDNISPDLRFYRDREASPLVLRVYAAHTPRERSPMRLRRIRLARRSTKRLYWCASMLRIRRANARLCACGAYGSRDVPRNVFTGARLCCAYAAQSLAYAPAANTARKYIQIAGIQSFLNLTCYTEIMKLLQCVGMIYVVR